jgi:hypothetical protein
MSGKRMRREVLKNFVQANNWTIGAEIGLLHGDTIFYLLDNCPNLTMYGVDLWEHPEGIGDKHTTGFSDYAEHDFEGYKQRVLEKAVDYHGRAKILVHDSRIACELVPDAFLDFVFIDADHRSSFVAGDIAAWAFKVKPEGWIFGHDTNFDSVHCVIDRMVPGWKPFPNHVWGLPVKDTMWGV